MNNPKPWMAATLVLVLVVIGLLIYMVSESPCPGDGEPADGEESGATQPSAGEPGGKSAGSGPDDPDAPPKSPEDKPEGAGSGDDQWSSSDPEEIRWPEPKTLRVADPAEVAQGWTEVRTFLGHKPHVLAVMSRPIPPYKQCLDHFKKHFDGSLEAIDLQSQGTRIAVLEQINKGSPDLYLAIGSKAWKLLKKHVRNRPVLYVMVLLPGKVPASMAGIAMHIPAKEHLQALKLLAPQATTVMFPYNPMRSERRAQEFAKVGKELGLKVVLLPAESKKDMYALIQTSVERTDACFMPMDQDVVANFALLHSLTIAEQKPLLTFSYKYVEMGATLAVCPKFAAMGAQAAELARRILQGEPPSEYSSLYPDEHYYSINTVSAMKIGTGVPSALLKVDHKLYR